MSRKTGAPRMNVALHALLTVATAGVFVPIWFSWARQWLDTLVPGMRIPRWGPVVSLSLSLLTLVSVILAFAPFDPFPELRYGLVAAFVGLAFLNGTVITLMSLRAREILIRYSAEAMPVTYEISSYWTLSGATLQLQHHINVISLIAEWEPA